MIDISISCSKIKELNSVTVCPCGFMNNILSGTKYRASLEGVSLMDETNNLVSHLERSHLIHSYGYAHHNESAGGRSSNLLNQLAPKIQSLHATSGLSDLKLCM